jgi:hypothetical protein
MRQSFVEVAGIYGNKFGLAGITKEVRTATNLLAIYDGRPV